MMSESISEIGLMIQGHLQSEMSCSKSRKLDQALWQKCLFGLSLNDVEGINF